MLVAKVSQQNYSHMVQYHVCHITAVATGGHDNQIDYTHASYNNLVVKQVT